MPVREVDPFLDADFAPLDTRDRESHAAALTQIADEVRLGPQAIPTPPAPPEPSPESEPVPEDQPETFDVDGGTVTISYDKKKGWTGTLELSDGGGTETFFGKTQKDLIGKVLTGKLNATKQIRKLNKKIKLGTPTDTPVPVTEPVFQSKQLDANDIFEIKTALEADPDKAFDIRFQKKYGMSESDFVALVRRVEISAKKGEEANDELVIESVSREFLDNHKDDYTPYAENGQAIAYWLCKNKLKRNPRTGEEFGPISSELLKKGLYTVDNLEEAFEDLRDSGLLVYPPEQGEPVAPEPAPVQQVEPVQPAPQNPRIASQRRQPRGGLGIRPGSVQSTPVEESRAPSADELDNMPQDQLRELLNQTYRHARSTRR